ncbi:protein of unknown function [Streptomyces sp. KY75]|nr:protein of unknown function [Streptomyces sp. KY75]CAD5980888.1 protein of unknown function [Streptomyces sp. KY70]
MIEGPEELHYIEGVVGLGQFPRISNNRRTHRRSGVYVTGNRIYQGDVVAVPDQPFCVDPGPPAYVEHARRRGRQETS